MRRDLDDDKIKEVWEDRAMRRIRDIENNKKGFTLVELIVVVVIVAILVGILITSYVAYIGKAQKQEAKLEARACVLAAQTYASENYQSSAAVSGTATAAEIKDIEKLAETEGTINSIYFKSDKVSKLVFVSKDKITVIYENGKYRLATESSGSWYDFSGLNVTASTKADAEGNLGKLASLFSSFMKEKLPSGAVSLGDAIDLGSGSSNTVRVNDSMGKQIGTFSGSEFKEKMNDAGFSAGSLTVVMKNSSTTPAYYYIKNANTITGSNYSSTTAIYFDPASGKIVTKAEAMALK